MTASRHHVHPAASLAEPLRIEYARLVVSLVRADGKADLAELSRVRRLCSALGLLGESFALVEDAIVHPDFVRIEEWLRRFSADDGLRFSLMTDAMVIAFADGKLEGGEGRELVAFAEVLGFTAEQVVALAQSVEATIAKNKRSAHHLSDQLAPRLENLPHDPASTADAINWLHDHLKS